MKNTQHTHTPGPWVATNCGSHIQVHREGWPRDAWSVCSFGFQANDKANANLVAASPDLLAFAREAVKAWELYATQEGLPQDGSQEPEYVTIGRAAIAKATAAKAEGA